MSTVHVDKVHVGTGHVNPVHVAQYMWTRLSGGGGARGKREPGTH